MPKHLGLKQHERFDPPGGRRLFIFCKLREIDARCPSFVQRRGHGAGKTRKYLDAVQLKKVNRHRLGYRRLERIGIDSLEKSASQPRCKELDGERLQSVPPLNGRVASDPSPCEG